ncbi:response regulator [Bacillus suaedaesalsae]|uniref:Response regulator n=1 Tax=Bacillus suaedaesalsae TaxID=2810349 RepID=A0ABS2DF34_9BACI|nr:response regulator [Bacillus suaedaesalsae]MBM6617076.1 response regulator [Bacillus suaedaesalsae]
METLIEVLIVEDDLRIADIHRRFTEKIEGFTVIGTATTGEQAKEWIETIQPQLILLDVYLPDIKGIELVTYIREHYQFIDIIMITAASEVEVIQHALRGGVSDYIVKPLTFERFKRSLEQYRNKFHQLSKNKKLTAEEVDLLWHGTKSEDSQGTLSPKGIDQLTLDKILNTLSKVDAEGITAEQLSKVSGVSRSTARRYLEFLSLENKVQADLIYGNVGRPERRYSIKK